MSFYDDFMHNYRKNIILEQAKQSYENIKRKASIAALDAFMHEYYVVQMSDLGKEEIKPVDHWDEYRLHGKDHADFIDSFAMGRYKKDDVSLLIAKMRERGQLRGDLSQSRVGEVHWFQNQIWEAQKRARSFIFQYLEHCYGEDAKS